MMGILSRGLLQHVGTNQRALSYQQIFERGLGLDLGRPATSAARGITATSAERLSTVHACTSLISDDLSGLPVTPMSLGAGADAPTAADQPKWMLEPNPDQTPFDLFESLWMSLLYRGNAFWHVLVEPVSGDIVEVWPLDPDRVTPVRGRGRNVTYSVRLDDGTQRRVGPYRQRVASGILHVAWHRRPGSLMGTDPIARAREAIAMGLVTEEAATSFFQNGSQLSGVIEVDGVLDDDEIERLRVGWEAAHAGPHRTGSTALLTDGAKFKPVSITPENAQFLETRRFQVSEICRLYRVPPHLVSDVEKSTSWGTGIEEQAIGYVTHTLLPLIRRGEQKLATLLEPGQFLKFNVAGLMRGDMKGRYDAYSKGIMGGWLSPNDVRALEDMDQVDGLDIYLQQLNMAPIGSERRSA